MIFYFLFTVVRLFCFEAIKWPACTNIKFLNQVFRQGSSESDFVRMLAEIRLGQCSDQTNRVSRKKEACFEEKN